MKKNLKLIILLSGTCIFSIIAFETLKTLGFYLLGIILYSVATLAFALYYICYNRGVLRVIRKDELPDSLSDSEKEEFLTECLRRRQASKWAIYVLLPLIAAFVYEIISIYFLSNLNFLN